MKFKKNSGESLLTQNIVLGMIDEFRAWFMLYIETLD